MITKNELLEKINTLYNPQDRLLVAGAFYGLYGSKGYNTMANIKTSDIDMVNDTISVEGKKVIMDETLKKLVSDALAQTIHYKVGGSNGSQDVAYELNSDSEYLIKTRPCVQTNNGTAPLKYEGMKSRVLNLLAEIKLDMNIADVKQSGAYHLLAEKKFKWTIVEAEAYLKEHSLSIRRNNLLPMIRKLKAMA